MDAVTEDGVALHWESHGDGDPILFVHEFGGDHRSWAPQVEHFSGTRRCLVYAARGYPPSGVPDDPAAYSQDRAVADALCVLDAAGEESAHVVGNSMGGFATLHLGLRHPERARSLVVAGCGYGAHPDDDAAFRTGSRALAGRYADEGAAAVAADYGASPGRLFLRDKDPAAYDEHMRILGEHDATGAGLTMRGVQAARPSLYDLRDDLAGMHVPTLVVAGDHDGTVPDVGLMLLRTLPDAGLALLPRSGHLTNLEEPELFNRLVERFHAGLPR